jgi:RNA polymerase sigma-70 factor, ECF subfamily
MTRARGPRMLRPMSGNEMAALVERLEPAMRHTALRCSALKTWIFRILVNRAKSEGVRERRSVPMSAFGDDCAVDPDRFSGGRWLVPPQPWGDPEERLLQGELRDRVRAELAALPPVQRAVVTLRDLEGLDSGEVCDLLSISAGNQRVLLHRGRTRLRVALAAELARNAHDHATD